MSAYEGRFESTTTARSTPDPNLAAYASEQGLSTALLGVVFAGSLKKVYTYWGHTGIKRGDYVVVNVPGGAGQQEKIVRVQAVLPAASIKSSWNGAKHFVRRLEGASPRIPLYTTSPDRSGFVGEWVNTTSLQIAPLELTNHARKCIGQIGGMLGVDPVNGDHADALLYGFGAIEWKTDEEVRKMFCGEFNGLEQRALSAQGHEAHRQLEKALKLGNRYGFGPQEMLKAYLPVHGTVTGRGQAVDNIPRRSKLYGDTPDMLIVDDLTQPKETTVSAKIENVTYVTLPGATSRRDAKTLSKEEFFDAIAALEARYKQLDGVKRKPRALQEELANLNQQIEDLSNLCDERFATKEKANTTPASADKVYTATDVGAARD